MLPLSTIDEALNADAAYYSWHDDVTDERRWSLPECLVCWQCTSSLSINARNNILWNLGFQALGLVSVVGAIGFEGKLHASDVATLVNVAIAVPILSLLVRALRQQNVIALRALNRWIIAVAIGYGIAVLLDLVSAARFCAACLEHSAAPYPFAGGAPPGAPPPAPSPPPSPHHPPVPTVGPHAIVNPYAHQNNQCWRGHQRATLLGQLVADASSVYTFACQIYYNRLLMLHWAATARMAAEGGGAGGPVHAHVEHGRLRVAVEVSPKCAAAGA